MSNCPHGFPHPEQATYPFRIGRDPSPVTSGRVVRMIADSRECPDCLRTQLNEAHLILNRIFLTDRGVLTAETYTLWVRYVEVYNP